MAFGTRTPLSVEGIGQYTALKGVTNSHGIIRPNMVDMVDFAPKLTVKRVPEYDNTTDALMYTTYDGGSGKISYTRSNQAQLDSLVMDLDPLGVELSVLNPALMQPFILFANLRGADSKFKGAWILYNCLAHGNPYAGSVKDAAKQSIDFDYLNGNLYNGAAILYTRARANVPLNGAPAAPTVTTAATGGFLIPGVYYVRFSSVTSNGNESKASNEVAITVPTGTSTNTLSVTIPATSGNISSYNVYVSNVSNGEKFSVNVATSGVPGTATITVLPPATTSPAPNIDKSGAFQAVGDAIFASNSITLAKTALFHPQTGLPYALILKNGAVFATPDNPASDDTFNINTAGTTFTVNATPADNDWWDIFTLYTP